MYQKVSRLWGGVCVGGVFGSKLQTKNYIFLIGLFLFGAYSLICKASWKILWFGRVRGFCCRVKKFRCVVCMKSLDIIIWILVYKGTSSGGFLFTLQFTFLLFLTFILVGVWGHLYPEHILAVEVLSVLIIKKSGERSMQKRAQKEGS